MGKKIICKYCGQLVKEKNSLMGCCFKKNKAGIVYVNCLKYWEIRGVKS